MENRINIAKLLKDCPKGMELYSPLCGKCVFDRVNFGTIICKKQNTQDISFTSEGYYMLPVFDNCECMIFPSKDQRDWSKFEPPYKFKDGDMFSNTEDDVRRRSTIQVLEYARSLDAYNQYGKADIDQDIAWLVRKGEHLENFDERGDEIREK